ncbi:MAG: hypothetical protein KDC87_06840, partial [Planctomycetes bacterium]|nr:hypothetical protein [Planctomycetota bacterium]
MATVLEDVAAQQPLAVREGPGLIATGDFDGDQREDLVLFGWSGRSGTYLADPIAPGFRHRGGGPGVYSFDLTDTPLYVGGYLYVPIRLGQGGYCELRVFAYAASAWTLRRSIVIAPSTPSVSVSSFKLCPYHADVDGDKQPDVLAVWGETPIGPTGAFRAAVLSPTGPLSIAAIPRVTGQTTDSAVVDVHRAKPMVVTKQPEYLVTLSAASTDPGGGFGFVTLGQGLAVGAGVWASGGPALNHAAYFGATSPVAYGDFRVLPTMKTPLVQVTSGRSVLFKPWVSAPYVANNAEILLSSSRSLLLDTCVADFDGDGRD